MSEIAVRLKNISMAFPGVRALDRVSFDIKKGEIHAIVGENGAGKSTLIKILAGVESAIEGEIELFGKRVNFKSPEDAKKCGIGVVYQELSNFMHLDVMNNLLCGNLPRKGLLLDYKAAYQHARDMLNRAGMAYISEKMPIRYLSLGNQQMVEIASLLSKDARIIIFDEPTSALTNVEVDRLFEIITGMKQKGVTIIYISHRLDEIINTADTFTVLKDGQHVITAPMNQETTKETLVRYMVGRDVEYDFNVGSTPAGDVLLEVENLSCGKTVRNVNFKVRSGEILGIAGLEGSGRTELLETLYGWRKPSQGALRIRGRQIKVKNTRYMKRNGLAYITKERKLQGLFLSLNVRQNISAASTDKYQRKGLINYRAAADNAEKYINAMGIKCSGPNHKTVMLSGGNQQKVLLAMWSSADPAVVLIDEPTRGVDVGAKAEIHKLLREFAGKGKAVIMVSSELPEIIASCDRVLVMHEGKVVSELLNKELNEEKILHLASGLAI
jgi:ABC-type sugar transport system ATPase subunit